MARMLGALTLAASAFAQAPQITAAGVVNAASYSQPISPGSLATILGTYLAPCTRSAQEPFPTELLGASVTVNGRKAPLLFVSPAQINVEIPSATYVCYECAGFTPVAFTVKTLAGASASRGSDVHRRASGIYGGWKRMWRSGRVQYRRRWKRDAELALQ